jgi:O-antigen/teichoic acid export membrane protein
MGNLKKIISNKLPKNAFVRSISVLVGGTMGAQALTLLAAPLLTRIYSPDDFGLLAVFTSMLAIALLVGSLRYDIAIPIPEDNIEATNLVVLSFILILFNTILIAVSVLFMSKPIADVLGLPVLASYLWLLPLGVLLGGTYGIFSQWSIRMKCFGVIASTRIWQSFISLVIQFSFFKFGGVGLLLASVAGKSVGAAKLVRPKFREASWAGIRKAAKRYRRFPIYSTPAGLARVLGVELPSLLLVATFSPAAAGLYALTNRVLGVPANLIGGAVSQVFVSSAADAYRNGSLAPLVKELHAKMAQIGLPFMFLLIMLGPELFGFVFGEDWRQAGEFACWMAPWLYLVFISSPITTVTAVLERQKQGMFFHFSLLAFRVMALYVGISTGDLTITIIIFAVVNAIWRLVFLLWLYVLSGNRISSFAVDSLVASAKALLCVTPVAIALILFSEHWIYAFVVSLILIAGSYWRLIKQAY